MMNSADSYVGGLGRLCRHNLEYKETKYESSIRIYLSWGNLIFLCENDRCILKKSNQVS